MYLPYGIKVKMSDDRDFLLGYDVKTEKSMKKKLIGFVRIKELGITDRERIESLGVDILQASNFYILPGFTDVHVHLREPGFLYKETMATGTMAAAAGGFTDIFSMPNLNPCPDSRAHLQVQLDAVRRDAKVNVYPYGTITAGQQGEQLSAMADLAGHVIAFTDDGKGVASAELMLEAMKKAKALGKTIVAHCEDESYPQESSESEWKQLERDIELVRKAKCSYHACHISTKESLQLIRNAKAEGLDITCETAPHYLLLSQKDIKDSGRFKMNPPIKSPEDQAALITALQDGTIDMIATDHAPHSAEEKSKGFNESAFGIVGLETAFAVLYTRLVKKGIITLNKLIALLYDNPRRRFSLPNRPFEKELSRKAPTFTLWDLDESYTVDSSKFLSKGKSTPFKGWQVYGRCKMTVINGSIVWKQENQHKG